MISFFFAMECRDKMASKPFVEKQKRKKIDVTPYEDKDKNKNKKIKIKQEEEESKHEGTLSRQRKVLRRLRHPSSTPDTMLPNGITAGEEATLNVLQNHMHRSNKKGKNKNFI